MPTENPRLNVTLQPEIAALLAKMAKREKKSISGLTKELLLEALDLREDMALSKLAELREREQKGKKYYSHEEAWR
jgi:mannose/fructose-specific phosphotransferase system component IIA